MQEPYDDATERPRLVACAGQQMGERWISVYADRVANNLRTFLRLKPGRQGIVVAAREDGFWWRGEHEDVLRRNEAGKLEKLWLFTLVLREYERQREIGAAAYRIECVRRMKTLQVCQSLPYDPAMELSGER